MKTDSIRLKKSSKFLILILASLLIGLANAAVYYSMIAQPSVSIISAKVVFVPGNDMPADSSFSDNSTWVYLALKAYPNITLTYDQPLNISNTDSVLHTFRLRHITISPANGSTDVGNFIFINFVVEDTTGVAQASFNYTTAGNDWLTPAATSYLPLPANTAWVIHAETRAAANANDVTANIQIAVDVT